MRSSALIFHTMDPETLDKIDDLSSLDSLDLDGLSLEEESDKYSLESSSSSENPKHETRTPSVTPTLYLSLDEKAATTPTTKTDVANRANYESDEIQPQRKPESHCHNNGQRRRYNGTNKNVALVNSPKGATVPISKTSNNNTSVSCQNLESSLSTSPVNKSEYYHYQVEAKHSKGTTNHNHNGNRRTVLHNGSSYSDDNKMGGSTSSQLKITKHKTFTSGLPLNLVKGLGRSNSTNAISALPLRTSIEGKKYEYENPNAKSFSRFFFNLDFRQNKEDKSRIDIYNLSPKLREELKRIYVY